MPRPARSLSKARRYARRRHRAWMYSMTAATLGWGCWWLALLLHRLVPGAGPGVRETSWAAGVFAVGGLVLGLGSVRAGRAWLLFVLVALFANASLLFLPWFVADLAPEP